MSVSKSVGERITECPACTPWLVPGCIHCRITIIVSGLIAVRVLDDIPLLILSLLLRLVLLLLPSLHLLWVPLTLTQYYWVLPHIYLPCLPLCRHLLSGTFRVIGLHLLISCRVDTLASVSTNMR